MCYTYLCHSWSSWKTSLYKIRKFCEKNQSNSFSKKDFFSLWRFDLKIEILEDLLKIYEEKDVKVQKEIS